QWQLPEDDPVFGQTIADQYKQLADRVRQSEGECV
ncbi:hemerythrin domain-containing protein, partial [Vibrio lentus]